MRRHLDERFRVCLPSHEAKSGHPVHSRVRGRALRAQERDSGSMAALITRSRAEIVGDGRGERGLRVALESGALVRVRAGHFADAEAWRGAHPEEREEAAARAAQRAAHRPHVFSHATAAALHGLPLFRHTPHHPHVMLGAHDDSGDTPGLSRHHDQWDGRWVMREGLRVTTLTRTVFDVLRTTRAETAIACVDAALRAASRRGSGALDDERADGLRENVLWHVRKATGRRGIRQARELVALADPRAESPGESVSRLHLHRLGYHGVGMQVPVTSPSGGTFRVDFDIDGVLGEFDGTRKYVDRALSGGRSAEQVVIDEKRREDWIRARTGKRLIRWTHQEIATPDRFLSFLRSVDVWPSGRPRDAV